MLIGVKALRQAPLALIMEEQIPEPSATESETLTLHISNWQNRTPLEQAICLAVLRGHCYPSQITKYLRLDVGEVEAALAVLMKNGLVEVRSKLLLR
jgi:hypothetical protein